MNSRKRLPEWLKKPIPMRSGRLRQTSKIIASLKLNTICESGACPNRSECYSQGHTTIMLMGNTCSRHCPYCDVPFGALSALEADEPYRVAVAIQKLDLKYVVLTSVTRDDLPDGGAQHIADTIHRVKERVPGILIEVLIPDFGGNLNCVNTVLEAKPDVLSHNIETVERLFKKIRPGTHLETALSILNYAGRKEHAPLVKTGIMLGLGETEEDLRDLFGRLTENRCRALTMGQYLQPPSSRMPVKEFISPDRFTYYSLLAQRMGIPHVKAGPFVRSSYLASTLLEDEIKARYEKTKTQDQELIQAS